MVGLRSSLRDDPFDV